MGRVGVDVLIWLLGGAEGVARREPLSVMMRSTLTREGRRRRARGRGRRWRFFRWWAGARCRPAARRRRCRRAAPPSRCRVVQHAAMVAGDAVAEPSMRLSFLVSKCNSRRARALVAHHRRRPVERLQTAEAEPARTTPTVEAASQRPGDPRAGQRSRRSRSISATARRHRSAVWRAPSSCRTASARRPPDTAPANGTCGAPKPGCRRRIGHRPTPSSIRKTSRSSTLRRQPRIL